MKKALLVLLAAVALTGCEERYRYPCQDPEHWSEKQCQKPFCSANGTCPEDLSHYEKNKPAGAPVVTSSQIFDTKSSMVEPTVFNLRSGDKPTSL